MKSTPLEKLVKADLILQVQEQYSRKTCKRSDKLEKRIGLYRQRLLDNKLREELKLNKFLGIDHYVNFDPTFGKECFDPYDHFNNSRRLRYTEAIENFTLDAESIEEHISGYEQRIERHRKFKEDWKLFLKMKNKYYQSQEMKALLAGTGEGLPVSLEENRRIKSLLKIVSYWKDYLYSYNGRWNATLTKDEKMLGIFEQMEDSADYHRLHPFE